MTPTINASHVRHGHAWIPARSRNMHGFERGARLFLGTASMGAAAAVGSIWFSVPLVLIGAGGILTGLSAYCPVKHAAGLDVHHHRPELK
jgi:hypothetical protein